MGNRQASAQLKTQERRQFVLGLRKTGMTYQQIAEAAIKKFGVDRLPLGYDSRYVYKDVVRELNKLKALVGESAEQILSIELERLDRMLVGLWKKAVSGDVSAIGAVLRIMDRRATYLGLDAARHIVIEDWRDKFKEAGVDPQEIFNAMVEAAAERMKAENEKEG